MHEKWSSLPIDVSQCERLRRQRISMRNLKVIFAEYKTLTYNNLTYLKKAILEKTY